MSAPRPPRDGVADNPVRIARIKAKLPQSQLADLVGISRSSLIAIEDGRTRAPGDDVLGRIAVQLGKGLDELRTELVAWLKRLEDAPIPFSPRQTAILGLSPADITSTYRTFVEWRGVFADTPSRFAQMLRVSHMTVARYEAGARVRGMPEVLQSALMTRLGLTPQQVVALSRLDPGDTVDGD